MNCEQSKLDFDRVERVMELIRNNQLEGMGYMGLPGLSSDTDYNTRVLENYRLAQNAITYSEYYKPMIEVK